jgi:hypothetical protein
MNENSLFGSLPGDYDPPAELVEMLSELLDDELSAERRIALEEMLLSDPSARAFYYHHLRVHACLDWSKRRTTFGFQPEEIAQPAPGSIMDPKNWTTKSDRLDIL